MKCIQTFGIGKHKRQADIALLFDYILYINNKSVLLENKELQLDVRVSQ